MLPEGVEPSSRSLVSRTPTNKPCQSSWVLQLGDMIRKTDWSSYLDDWRLIWASFGSIWNIASRTGYQSSLRRLFYYRISQLVCPPTEFIIQSKKLRLTLKFGPMCSWIRIRINITGKNVLQDIVSTQINYFVYPIWAYRACFAPTSDLF